MKAPSRLFELRDGSSVLTLGAGLDGAVAAELARSAEEFFGAGGRSMIIDLSCIKKIEPKGIMGLIAIVRRVPEGSCVVLANLSPYAEIIARITQLHSVFDIYRTVEGAGQALSGLGAEEKSICLMTDRILAKAL